MDFERVFRKQFIVGGKSVSRNVQVSLGRDKSDIFVWHLLRFCFVPIVVLGPARGEHLLFANQIPSICWGRSGDPLFALQIVTVGLLFSGYRSRENMQGSNKQERKNPGGVASLVLFFINLHSKVSAVAAFIHHAAAAIPRESACDAANCAFFVLFSRGPRTPYLLNVLF